jgi:hypothetical protein
MLLSTLSLLGLLPLSLALPPLTKDKEYPLSTYKKTGNKGGFMLAQTMTFRLEELIQGIQPQEWAPGKCPGVYDNIQMPKDFPGIACL